MLLALYDVIESRYPECGVVSVAAGPYAEVVKLQQMCCLFEAYEHVLSLLERVFTPMFCHSDEVRAHEHGYIHLFTCWY